MSNVEHGAKGFVDEVISDIPVHPVSIEIARRAGVIEGQRAAQGISIALEESIIGSTALHFGFSVATFNVRHFQLVPGLAVRSA